MHCCGCEPTGLNRHFRISETKEEILISPILNCCFQYSKITDNVNPYFGYDDSDPGLRPSLVQLNNYSLSDVPLALINSNLASASASSAFCSAILAALAFSS